MLYLTLEDNPFHEQEYDENALLEFVRSVARRDGDDRSVSELIRFQDNLERLGLLWAPLDSLDKYQAQEFVRNLHLELSAPGDMVYLKHSPAMRSYVVLRGTVLLTQNLLDREGVKGVRTLGPGEEFGHPFDPDLDLSMPVTDFLEYAKAPHLEVHHDGSGEETTVSRRGSRKDVRAELLVIGRQDWIATIQCSRSHFAKIISRGVLAEDPDPLKSKARIAFNFTAKARKGEHHQIATKYLKERVAFCSDLPIEQVSAMAAAVELRGMAVSGRTVVRRGRECHGEAFIMFTGTADQRGGEKSGDRLIKEGDLFGDEIFTAAVRNVLGTPHRTATVISRTAPCELLVVPSRECRRLQKFVALRNSERAKTIFEKFFISLPREASSEIAALATFRTIKVHATLTAAGDDVTAVFFVFRGECLSKASKHEHRQRYYAKRAPRAPRRYGPGHIIGWPYVMREATEPGRRIPTSTKKEAGTATAAAAAAAASVAQKMVSPSAETPGTKQRGPRSRRGVKEWHETIVVTTPAQVLSVPLVALLTLLSEEARQGLRAYISLTYQQELEENPGAGFEDDDGGGGFGGDKRGLGLSNFSSGVFDGTNSRPGDAAGGELPRTRAMPPGSTPIHELRSLTAPELALERQTGGLFSGNESQRPSTTSLGQAAREGAVAHVVTKPFRPTSPTRWRWRVNLTGSADSNARTTLLPSPSSRGGRRRQPSPSSPSNGRGYVRGGVPETYQQLTGRGRCHRPTAGCRGCSALARLERSRNTTFWAPLLPSRSVKPASAPGGRLADRGGTVTHALHAAPSREGALKFGPQKTAGVYVHRQAATPGTGEGGRCTNPSGGMTVAAEAVVAAATEFSSLRLWSECYARAVTREDGGGCGGGDGGALRISTAPNRRTGNDEGDQCLTGTAGADSKRCITSDESASASSSPAWVSLGGRGPPPGLAAVAPTSDFGVAPAWGRLSGRSIQTASSAGRESSATADEPVLTAPMKQPSGRSPYALVQLTTRRALDPSGVTPASSAAGAPCLFIRILGSFISEAEATTRVLNLYHSILPTKLVWLPTQGEKAEGADHRGLETYSDHVFLLLKGLPVGRLSFDVIGTTYEDKNIGRNTNKNARSIGDDDDLIGCRGRSNNGSDSIGTADNIKHNEGVTSANIIKINNRARKGAEEIGRGYDAGIPAVFKAKGQRFAVVFAPSRVRVEEEWAREQQNQQLQELEERGNVNTPPTSSRTRNTEEGACSSPRHCDGGSAPCLQAEESPRRGVGSDNKSDEPHFDDAVETVGVDDGRSNQAAAEERTLSASGPDIPPDQAAAAVEATTVVEDEQGSSGYVGEEGCVDSSGGGDGVDAVDNVDAPAARASVDLGNETNTGRGAAVGESHRAHTGPPESTKDTIGGDGGFLGGTERGPFSRSLPESFPGSFADDLLDSTDNESLGNEERRRRLRMDRYCRAGGATESFLDDGLSDAEDDDGDEDAESVKAAGKRRGVLSWVVGRMGLLETVEGCYETEMKAFRRAVEILEGKETPLSSTRTSPRPRLKDLEARPKDGKENEQDGPNGEMGAPAARSRHSEQQSRSPAVGVNDNRACIMPLYEWIPLGDGGISAVENAIESRSVADPQQARRAGVDLFALWNQQRIRRLRANLYNLLQAAGPREIRSRCGLAEVEDDGRGGRCGRAGRYREGGDDDTLRDEGARRSGGFRGLGRKRVDEEAVRSARAAVLKQNQNLIQTEMDVRRRRIEFSGGGAPVARDRSPCREGRGGISAGATRMQENVGAVDGSRSVGGAGGWLGVGGGSSSGGGGGGDSGKKGLRNELRAQMQIERKRARLFEDIQTLPYALANGDTQGAKGSSTSSSSSKVGRHTTGTGGNERPMDEGHLGSSNSDAAAAFIVLRAPKVQAQKQLHGKPVSSFFARAGHIAGGALTTPTTGGSSVDEDRPSSSTAPSLAMAAGAAALTTAGQQAATAPKGAVDESSAVAADVIAVEQPKAGEETAPDGASMASSPGSCCTSAVSDGYSRSRVASAVEATGCTSSLGGDEDDKATGGATTRSSSRVVGRSETLPSRSAFSSRAGYNKGVGRLAAAKGADGRNTSRVPAGVNALDGELMLLDGILHDHKVRKWVETTLVPARKQQQRAM